MLIGEQHKYGNGWWVLLTLDKAKLFVSPCFKLYGVLRYGMVYEKDGYG